MPEHPIKEKTVAFIVARLSSSRLPAKHLRRIGDRPMLQWIVDRLRQCNELDQIVLATVNEPENRPLQAFAVENGFACFWYEGQVDQVTTRLRRAAEAFNADICVLVSGDCPLVHAPAIDEIIRSLKKSPDADTVRLPGNVQGQAPALQGIVAGRRRAWQLADNLADRPELKEHQFPVIGLRPECFNPIDVSLEESLYMPHHRLSVDTLADLAFMNALYDDLEAGNLSFELPHVVGLLKEQPELKKINAHVHQCRLVENKKKVLFAVDAGGGYGFGHLTRCLELARQMTERLAWSTHFLVDDHQAQAMIAERGYKFHWGAFGRSANRNRNRHAPAFECLASQYDLLVFDIFDQRGPVNGWRSLLCREISCVVIENTQPWAGEADLIVVPNILDKYFPKFSSDDSCKDRSAEPKVVGGERFIILRDEIRRLASNPPPKEIDVLVYLHDAGRRALVRKILGQTGLTSKIMDDFETNFVVDLARARVFISGFGVSFNEALALQTLPVCWPDSDAHREDAARFYRHLGMEPLLVESPEGLREMILSALNKPLGMLTPIRDGTPNIVAEIAALFEASSLGGE
jgi:spore coat polysaccharide biosynthesis protein SpsF